MPIPPQADLSMHLDAFVLGLAKEELTASLSSLDHQPADLPTPRLTEVAQPSAASSQASRRVCTNCQATNSSYWRKDMEGRALCNACGLFLRTHGRHRPLVLQRNREARRGKQRPPHCGNCGTDDTPLWRRVNGNETVCNACGLYFRLHGVHRPPPSAESKLQRSLLEQGTPVFIQEAIGLSQPSQLMVSPSRSLGEAPIVAGNVWHSYEPKTAAGGGGKFVMVAGYGTQVRLRRSSFDSSQFSS